MKVWIFSLLMAVGIMMSPATMGANAQVAVGYVETTIEDNTVRMEDQALIACEQDNSGGINRQNCAQINVAPTMIGYSENEIEDNTVVMEGGAEISCEQSNSGGVNTQNCAQINIG